MSCPITLNGIALDCKGMGGVKNIWIADRADVEEITDTAGEITAIAPTNLFVGKLYKTRKQVAMMESTVQNDEQAGTSYIETTLTASFAKMDKTKRLEIEALRLGDVVALVEDQNGEYWYLGYDNPVTLQEGSGTTGQAYADSNSYSITLIDMSREMPLNVDETIIDTLTVAPTT